MLPSSLAISHFRGWLESFGGEEDERDQKTEKKFGKKQKKLIAVGKQREKEARLKRKIENDGKETRNLIRLMVIE